MPSLTSDTQSSKLAVGKGLYANANAAELQKTADETLLYFGTEFSPNIITHASGVYIYTASGHKILDWTSGQMSCLIGHGNKEVVRTIHEHAASLDHLFSGMISPPVIKLAKQLTDLTSPGLDKAFFLSTGGESNEAAIKLAKVFTGKWEIVALSASWHGMTGQAVAAQYHSGRKGYGPMVRIPPPMSYTRQLTISRCRETTLYQHRMRIGRSSVTQMALTTGRPSSTMDGTWSTMLPAVRSQP